MAIEGSSPVFDVNVALSDGRATVSLVGELDVASSEGLQARLEALIAQGHRCLSLDLTDLRFIDSSGLAVFIDIHKRLEADGGELEVSHAQPPVSKVMEITGLARLLASRAADDVEDELPT
jgi:anti-anti-sigma factor